MGITKRPHYKRPRAPARTKGVLGGIPPPNACLDATPREVATALYSLGIGADIKIGRAGEYDSLKDLYTTVGKCMRTGKAQDFRIEGIQVAALIWFARQYNGGRPLEDIKQRVRTGSPGLHRGEGERIIRASR